MVGSDGIEKELVWVEKEFAEKYKLLESTAHKNAERINLFEEYMQKVNEESKAEFKSQLESLEEDAAIYTGLMLKVKQAFEKAKNEQLNASYDLWNKFEKEIPDIRTKIDKIKAEVTPLQQQLVDINKLLSSLQTYNIERVIEAVERLNSLTGTSKEMVEFLVKNFSK